MKRYKIKQNDAGPYCHGVEHPEGEWVKYSDIKSLIKKEYGGEKLTSKEMRSKRSRRVALRKRNKASLIYCLANNEKLTRIEIGELFGFSTSAVKEWLDKKDELERSDKIDELEQQGHSRSCAIRQAYNLVSECKCSLIMKRF